MQEVIKLHFWKILFAIIALTCGMTSTAAPAETKTIPIENFFKNSQFSYAQLAPDGKSIAMLMTNKEDRIVLGVLEIGQLQPRIIAAYDIRDITNFHWVNSERLVYSLKNTKLAQGETFYGPGLYAVNKDGTKRLHLVSHTESTIRVKKADELLPWNTFFLDTAHSSNSADIFVIQGNDIYSSKNDSYDLYRLNTVTGNTVLIPRPEKTGKVSQWLIDKTGVPRIAKMIDGPTVHLFYKDAKTEEWRKLLSYSWATSAGVSPLFFSPDGDLYVKANLGKDTASVYRFDLQKNQVDPEPVVSLKGYDFNGSFVYSANQKKILGMHYEMSMAGSVWFDDVMVQHQKKIDELLPYTINQMSVATDGTSNTVLVHSFSDINPGIWQLYDFDTDKFTRLGYAQPGINPDQMSPKEMVHYKAKDGMDIPASLTLPVNGSGKNLPLIMLVHGGPYVRGNHWDWSADAQFLASRGYAVLEPDYRGSTGYGYKHFNAGMKQWGLAMQDDIADGAKWAIAQGYADPQRICIAGASYGGYATLMGLIKDPDLYRCGVDWVGVTDINLLYDSHWSDASDEWKFYGMPVLVGDQIKDAEQLKATSPLENAASIKQPLLLAYGGSDRRVPIAHGTKFYNAVKKTNPNVEWVEYSEEGHGFYLLKNKVDFWTRVEKFLDQNIGKK